MIFKREKTFSTNTYFYLYIGGLFLIFLTIFVSLARYEFFQLAFRSPENEADSEEREFIRKLNKDPGLKEQTMIRRIDGIPYFVTLSNGETMEKPCLKCHGKPLNAPKELIRKYGDTRSFYRNEGEVVSAISIRVPMTTMITRTNHLLFLLSTILVSLLTIVFLAMTLVSKSLRNKQDYLEENIKARTAHLASVNQPLIKDISKRKQAEEELREANEKLNSIIQSSPLAIIVVDRLGVVLSWNKSAENIFGWQEKEVIGKVAPYIPEDRIAEYQENLTKELNGQQLRGKKFRRYKKDGQKVFIKIYTSQLHDSEGNITGFMAIIEDLTEHIRVKLEYQKSQKRAEQAMKMATLGAMAAGIAHEVNRPLNSIKLAASGMLYWFEEGNDPTKQQIIQNCRIISEQTEKTAEIIRHMRSIIKGDVYPGKTLVNLNGVVEAALDLISFQLTLKSVEIIKELTNPLPLIRGRTSGLEQVVVNIVLNAIQAFNGLDKQLKEIRCLTYVNENMVILEISDNAMGISKEVKDKLFTPFFTTKSGEGMGLGLFIVDTIVTTHEGQIQIINNQKGGATIKIEFPIANRL